MTPGPCYLSGTGLWYPRFLSKTEADDSISSAIWSRVGCSNAGDGSKRSRPRMGQDLRHPGRAGAGQFLSGAHIGAIRVEDSAGGWLGG